MFIEARDDLPVKAMAVHFSENDCHSILSITLKVKD
jgi:hypothetical protein